jgi:hypothetical protein
MATSKSNREFQATPNPPDVVAINIVEETQVSQTSSAFMDAFVYASHRLLFLLHLLLYLLHHSY